MHVGITEEKISEFENVAIEVIQNAQFPEEFATLILVSGILSKETSQYVFFQIFRRKR